MPLNEAHRAAKRKVIAFVFASTFHYHSQMNPLAVIREHRDELQRLGARRVGVFGSFVKGHANADSDVDVYIEFEEAKRTYDNFFAMHELLQQAFGRRVDLVTDKSLNEAKARLILPTIQYVA